MCELFAASSANVSATPGPAEGLLPPSPPGTAGFKSCSLGKGAGAARRPRSGRGRGHRPGPPREARGSPPGTAGPRGPRTGTPPGGTGREGGNGPGGGEGGSGLGFRPGKPAPRRTPEPRDRAGRGVAGSPTSPVIGERGGAGRRGAGRGPSADEAWDWRAGRDAPPALRARPGIGGRGGGRRARARGVTGHVVRNRRGGRCGEGLPRAESGGSGRARWGRGGRVSRDGRSRASAGGSGAAAWPAARSAWPAGTGRAGVPVGRRPSRGPGRCGLPARGGRADGPLLAPDEPRGLPEPLGARRRPGVRGRWGPPAFEAGRWQRWGRGRLAPSCPLRLPRLDGGAGPAPAGPCQPPPGWGRPSSRRRGVASCPARVRGRVAEEGLYACLGSSPRVARGRFLPRFHWLLWAQSQDSCVSLLHGAPRVPEGQGWGRSEQISRRHR